MHPDLSPHLHSPECNKLIEELNKCHEVNKFGKFIGKCNAIDKELSRCLKNERRNNQAANRQKALERQKRVKEFLKNSQ